MGMFNVIEGSISCPNCGGEVEWQSKNLSIRGYPIENLLLRITPEPDMDGEMHTSCHKCFYRLDADIVNGEVTNVRSRFLPHLAEQAARRKA